MVELQQALRQVDRAAREDRSRRVLTHGGGGRRDQQRTVTIYGARLADTFCRLGR